MNTSASSAASSKRGSSLWRTVKTTARDWLSDFDKLGPLGAPVFFVILALTIFLVSRLALGLIYLPRVLQEPRFYLMFPIGLRMDAIVVCYWLFLPTIFFLLLPKKFIHWSRYAWVFYFVLFIDIAFFMEMATLPFLQEYDLRPDAIFLRYLDDLKEVGPTVWAEDKWNIMVTVVLLVLVHWGAWKAFKRLVSNYRPMPWKFRLLLVPIVGILLFLGARSSLAPRPANISTAYFSEKNKLVNELTLNSTYSIFVAALRLSNEKDPSAFYGKMGEGEMLARVKRSMGLPDSAYAPSAVPFLHTQGATNGKRPMNVVIILEESLGAEYVGALGGLPLTPNLDRLSKEGLFFTNLYSTGTRTVRGIEAVVTGFLPTPGNSVVNLGLSRSGFFTSGALFKKYGYTTEFIYGGMSNFDEMRSFFVGNGFSDIYDEPTFRKPAFKGTWGVSDEDLMRKADEVFRSHGDKPFFAVVLSTSNHSPFEYPDGRIQPYDQPKQTVHNAMKYADYSIGLFFDLARKSEYYKNTLFLVVADHNTRVYGDEFIPVHKFHIPGLLIGPGVPAQAFEKVTSQVDLLPTLLHFAGLPSVHPMVGRDVLTLKSDDPGRCIMQYGNNYGYMKGDSLVVLKPYLPPQEFLYHRATHQLTPLSLDTAEAKDALAHALLPWHLYRTKSYRLE